MGSRIAKFFYKIFSYKKIKKIYLIDLCYITDKIDPLEINGDQLDVAIGNVYEHAADIHVQLTDEDMQIIQTVVDEACSQLGLPYMLLSKRDVYYLAEQIGSILINGTVAKESTK